MNRYFISVGLLFALLVGCQTPSGKQDDSIQTASPAPVKTLYVPLMQEEMARVSEYESWNRLRRSQSTVRSVFRGNGQIIGGRLILPDDMKVSSRAVISSDGSYLIPLYSGRQIIFYAHGYDPLVITETHPWEDVRVAAPAAFQKASEENLRTLTFRPIEQSDESVPTTVQSTLQIRNMAYLGHDHSNEPGAAVRLDVLHETSPSGDSVTFENLSRAPYLLQVRAPGYIMYEYNVCPHCSGNIDLGDIRLKKAETLTFTYRLRVRQSGGDWVTEDGTQTAQVVVDGENRFVFTDARGLCGNRFDIRLTPNDNFIRAHYPIRTADTFRSLGYRKPGPLPSFQEVDLEALQRVFDPNLHDGSTYYFQARSGNTEVEAIFRVERPDRWLAAAR